MQDDTDKETTMNREEIQNRATRWQVTMDRTEEYLAHPPRVLSNEEVWEKYSVIEEARMHRDHYAALLAR